MIHNNSAKILSKSFFNRFSTQTRKHDQKENWTQWNWNQNWLDFFQKSSTFELRRKKYGLKSLMMEIFLLKLTQFEEKTGSISKFFISLGYLIINFHFWNMKWIKFFVTFTFCWSKVDFAFFYKETALSLKRNYKSNREKSKLSLNKLKKKNQTKNLYKSFHYVYYS